MSAAIAIAALCVAVVAVLGVAASVWWDQMSRARPDWIVRRQARSMVIIELLSGETWQGVLLAADRRSVLLANPLNITDPDRPPVVAEGHVILDRSQIAHHQVALTTTVRQPGAFMVTADGFTEVERG